MLRNKRYVGLSVGLCENEGWVSIVQLSPKCGQTRGKIRQLKLNIALTLNVTKLST